MMLRISSTKSEVGELSRRLSSVLVGLTAGFLISVFPNPAASGVSSGCPKIETRKTFSDGSRLIAGEVATWNERKGASVLSAEGGPSRLPQGVVVVDGFELGSTQAVGPYGNTGKTKAHRWFSGFSRRLCSPPAVITTNSTVVAPVYVDGGTMLLASKSTSQSKEWISMNGVQSSTGQRCGIGRFVSIEGISVFVVQGWEPFCRVVDNKVEVRVDAFNNSASEWVSLEIARQSFEPAEVKPSDPKSWNRQLKSLILKAK
jgi:hypothetical protein